eukprot:gnl/MRDRNA2_/MRDRNA2_288609_c0_seq1.p2 gnl/MRDRNA2_/MRDRNA2_288609_c0~~gnl/MRDRNA2_/MRDRNA2_288609_c0_seq1.p2  ORF type:complete len:119 (-),score=5.63 gnl/MRDRNA2_/MRDRNA2_288609_c0_seq1:41-397(-)
MHRQLRHSEHATSPWFTHLCMARMRRKCRGSSTAVNDSGLHDSLSFSDSEDLENRLGFRRRRLPSDLLPSHAADRLVNTAFDTERSDVVISTIMSKTRLLESLSALKGFSDGGGERPI